MFLKTFERRLRVRLLRAERAFTDAVVISKSADRHIRRYFLEGAVNDAWQAYCDFSREVCVQSSIGCTRANGVVTIASILPATWERASYVALRAVKSASVTPGAGNDVLRKEPTWGDSSKIGAIIAALNPSNAVQLRTYLFGGLTGPKHCQIVRNAVAHKNYQSLAEVRALAVDYVARPIMLPTDALDWTEPTTGTYAFLVWLDEMRGIAAGAIG